MSAIYEPRGVTRVVQTAGAWLLALIWIAPLVYAVWTAFHPPEYSTRFELFAPLTLDNFARAWEAAPFAPYGNSWVMTSIGIAVSGQILDFRTDCNRKLVVHSRSEQIVNRTLQVRRLS